MEGGMPIDMGLNTASQGGESKEATQEDMIRVSESMQKAAQMGSQIRGDAQQSAQIAKFLEFLFAEVKNDKIRETVVELCSRNDTSGYNITLAIHELVLLFAPFFHHQFQEAGLQHVFQHEVPTVSPISIDNYIVYLRDVRQYYPWMQQMDPDTVASLVVALMEYFGYGSVEVEKRNDVIENIKNKLN